MRNCKSCSKLLNERHKVYCDNRCQNAYQRAVKLNAWLEGGRFPEWKWLPDVIRDYILSEADYACVICGWSGVSPVTNRTVLQIDHEDGDATNNSINNLRALCPNCHAMTPTFGSLNTGRGRPWRYGNKNGNDQGSSDSLDGSLREHGSDLGIGVRQRTEVLG